MSIPPKTGWPPGMLQDDDKKLSRWFASRPGARYQVRKNIMENERLAQEVYDMLEDALCDADWDYVVEAKETLSNYLSRCDALTQLVQEGQRLGGYD